MSNRLTDMQKRQRFERALELAGNTHTVADVLDKVREGRAQYWESGDCTVVTEVLSYPRLKACNYWLVSGSLSDGEEMQRDIDAWAFEQGCSVATATGRMGWLRITKTRPIGGGWKARGVAFWRPIVGGHG